MRIVSDLPGMTVRVDEDARVAAPERLRPAPRDRRAGGLCFGQNRVDLSRRTGVVRKRDPAPAAGVLDDRVLRELVAPPERHDHAAGLEEDDVVRRGRARLPAKRLVETASALEVADAECDEAQTLVHTGISN